jgi:hypothetical protein
MPNPSLRVDAAGNVPAEGPGATSQEVTPAPPSGGSAQPTVPDSPSAAHRFGRRLPACVLVLQRCGGVYASYFVCLPWTTTPLSLGGVTSKRAPSARGRRTAARLWGPHDTVPKLSRVTCPTLHLSCPSGASGNLVVSALSAVGAPADRVAALPHRLGVSQWLSWSWAPPLPGEQPVGDAQYFEDVSVPAPQGTAASMVDRVAACLGEREAWLVRRFTDAMYGENSTALFTGLQYVDTLFDLAAVAAGLWALRCDVVVHGPLPTTPRAHRTASTLLAGWPWQHHDLEAELVTPTAAGVLAVVATHTSVPFPSGDAALLTGRFAARYGLPPLRAVLR